MSGLIGFYISTLALLAPLVSCVGIGVWWGKRKQPFSGEFLTILVTTISTPALVFNTLYSTQLDNETLTSIGVASLLSLFVMCLATALVLRLLGLPIRSLLLTTAFPNSGNLGLPLSKLAFGDAGLSAAIVFFAICSFTQNTIGVRTLPNGGPGGAGWKSPILLASILAVGLRQIDTPVPAWVLESTHLVGSLTVPLMLLSLGYALSSIPSSGIRTGAFLAAIRLMLGLGCAWLVTAALGLEDTLASIVMLQMVMPCAVAGYIFTARYTSYGSVSAGAVLVSTLAFLLLSPAILLLLGASIPGLSF